MGLSKFAPREFPKNRFCRQYNTCSIHFPHLPISLMKYVKNGHTGKKIVFMLTGFRFLRFLQTCSGEILADRRQKKYILTELVMGEDFHFVFGGPVLDMFSKNRLG